MNALTIILAIYVGLDIVADTAIAIALKRRGYSLRELAWRLHTALRNRGTDFADYDNEDEDED